MKCLVTGGAGFIGSHLCEALLKRGDQVVCLDNFNDYYSPERKRRNVAPFLNDPNFNLVEGDIRDGDLLTSTFEKERPTHVAHLAAMAGPRYSIQKPALYEEVNVRGTLNMLGAAYTNNVQGFFQASTSSVYGLSPTPWSETSDTGRPLSPYAATKKAAEVLAFTYHSLYKLPVRIGRFFTVYGPKGRPDMTPYVFVDAMVKGQPITLFNGGQDIWRDWTYIDDIVDGIMAALDSDLDYEIINLGNSNPVQLIDFIQTLEKVTGLKARIESGPLPATDPPITFADTSKAKRLLNFEPRTPLKTGLANFWQWYQNKDS